MDASLFAHIPALSNKPAPKIEFEYQAVCLECEEYFGKDKKIWMQPHRKGVDERLMRYALKECKQRNKPFVNYFIAILNANIKKQNQSKISPNRA